jgi:small ligand-binding sensory domain FIST
MAPFRIAHTAADDWAQAAKACADDLGRIGGGLGFLYVTDDLADDFASVLTYVRQKTGVESWVGSVGLGVCGGDREYFDRPAVAALVADLPAESFCIFPTIEDQARNRCSWWAGSPRPGASTTRSPGASPAAGSPACCWRPGSR